MTGIELCKKCAGERAILERKKRLSIHFNNTDNRDDALLFVNNLRHYVAGILKSYSTATLMDIKDVLDMKSDYRDCQVGFTRKSALDWSVSCIKKGTIEILMNDLEVLDDCPTTTFYADDKAVMTCYDGELADIFHSEEYYDNLLKTVE
jgi:hypothetical protein